MPPRSGHGRSFARRLLAGDGGRDEDALRRDILDNLQVLLNSRPGAPSAPQLGLSAYNEIALHQPDAVARLEAQLQELCRRYEPRIEELVVTRLPCAEPGTLRFSIAGVLRARARRAPFTIDTAIIANAAAIVGDLGSS
jgi:type VI secretion system lysozyme-like protein